MILRTLRESFIPLLVVLLGLVGLTAFFDGRAEDMARRETVIALAPLAAGGDDGRLTDNGMVASAEGVALDASDRPEIVAARDYERVGALDEAMKVLDGALAKAPANGPPDALLLDEVAVVALRQGKLELAATSLERVLAAEPDNATAHFNRALVATRQGQPAVARTHYAAVVRVKPNDFEAHYNLGLLELDEGHVAEAEKELETAVGSGSGAAKARALFSLGVAQARGGKEEQALASYARSIEYAPSYLLPRYNQAIIYNGRKDAAAKAEATRLVGQMLALRPDFAPAWFLKGRIASEASDPEVALRAYEKAAAHDPTFFKARYNAALVALDMNQVTVAQQRFERLVVDFPDRAEPVFNLARLAHKRDDEAAAIGLYQKAIALKQGKYPEAQLNLAVAQRAAGELDDALATLDRLLADDPTMSSAQLNRGLVLVKMKRPDDAKAALEAAIAMRPDYAFAWYNLGKLESSQGHVDKAIAAYRQALAADPKLAKAAVNLGVQLAAQEHWDDAIAVYQQALQIAPDDATAHFNLALAYRATARWTEAIEEYKRVIELDDDHITARRNLGVAYSKIGQHALAILTYQQALDLDASSVGLRVNLAGELRHEGRTAEAQSEYERALRLDPGHRGATAALAAMYVAAGKNREALALIAPFAERGKVTAEMRQVEGQAKLALGDAAGAQEAFAKARSAAPSEPEGDPADPAAREPDPGQTP